ncbi:MAG: sulfurtransferase [Burkholderiales bacterium]|nr:MAG: sulfurtransferase [Burkholderiales bacterium]
MSYGTLISVEALQQIQREALIVDCRYNVMKPDAGREAYDAGHVPGAFFLSVDSDLAGPVDGSNGRHPLPDRATLRQRLESFGLNDHRQLVVYDAAGGQVAARLWWLAKWLGHDAAAVLDGGFQAWTGAGLPLSTEMPVPVVGQLSERTPLAHSVDLDAMLYNLEATSRAVVDARSAPRYRGETEPIDPVAGHIPGSINRPSQDNLGADGRLKAPDLLRAEFAALLGQADAAQSIHSCGSGVAACHNLLAMQVAGMPMALLYPGSWSEWCADPARPIATGPNP